jgi:phosphatidylglycerol:prolipoprotein diacylglycerol transferase
LRDDTERGEFGPQMGEHWLISGSLLVMSIAFVFGISLGIAKPQIRNIARVLAFVPPVVAFIALRPVSFGKQQSTQLSTSQWVGLVSAVACAYFYAKFWEEARKSPKLAMGLESLGDIKATADDMMPRKRKSDDDDEEGEEHDEPEDRAETEDEEQTAPEAPVAKKPKKKKGLKKKTKKVSEPAEDEPSEDADEPSDEKPKDDDKTEVDSSVEEKDDA